MTTTRSIALVTGASKGLGLAIARNLARRGHGLVLVARGEEGLQRVADALEAETGARPLTLACDLSRPGAADDLVRRVQARGLAIEVLVNNAGMGLHGAFVDMDGDALAAMSALNVGALTELCHRFLPEMVRRGRGRVLNVASLAAFQPGGPNMAAYYADKAYVLALSRGLRAELAGTGVGVTALCPGPMATDFFQAGGGFAHIALNRLPKLDVERVAELGCRGLSAGRELVVPGLAAKLLAIGGMTPPRALAMTINRRLLAPQAEKLP